MDKERAALLLSLSPFLRRRVPAQARSARRGGRGKLATIEILTMPPSETAAIFSLRPVDKAEGGFGVELMAR